MPNDTPTVPADGPLESRLLIVGEAPGPVEEQVGKPFRGPSGDMLTRWLRSIGVSRWDVRCDNVLHFRPPGNKIEAAGTQAICEGMTALRRRTHDMPNLRCIVTLGNYATYCFTGRGKVMDAVSHNIDPPAGQGYVHAAERQAGITVLRGSRYLYTSQCINVIPTIHPAFYLRGMLHREKLSYYDFRKVAEVLAGTAPPPPQYKIITNPTERDLHALLEQAGRDAVVSCDIETPGNRLSCIGFATEEAAYVIPYDTKAVQRAAYPVVARLLSSPNIAKVFHNGSYDLFWLADYFDIRGPIYDTMHMHHVLDPLCPHALHVVSSIYTWQPYWKAEAKEAEEIMKVAGDKELLYHYNGMDAAVTLELFHALQHQCNTRGLWPFYLQHYSKLTFPVMRMSRHGILRDVAKADARSIELASENDRLLAELKETAGEDLWANKDFSSVKLQRYFYDKLGLPKKMKLRKSKDGGKKRSATLDETALVDLAVKFPEKAAPVVEKILAVRGNLKQIQFLTSTIDRDGRYRASFTPTADTGRFKSSKNPKRTGGNLQNQDNRVKSVLMADPDCILIEIDLSQAEHRIVLMLTMAPHLIEVANTRPTVYDAHKENAAKIFKVPVAEVTKEQRTMGKRAVHAAERGMKGRLFADILLKDTGRIYSVKYCDKLLDAYHASTPEVRNVYFKRVEDWIRGEAHRIVNPYGRCVDFSNMPLWGDAGGEVIKAGYAVRPQGDVADLVNQFGIIPLDDLIIRERLWTRLHIQNHDSLVFSSPLEEAYDVTQFLCRQLETPVDYDGAQLVIPTEIAIGRHWDKAVEWKELPSKDEFNERAKELLSTN